MKNVSLHRRFGHNVRKNRLDAGYSQTQFGEKIGLTRASISNIELGRQSVTLETFVRIARTFNLSLDAMIDK